MLKLVSLILLCLHMAACQRCGTPDRAHPPSLRTSGDRILGLRQGIVGGDEANPHSYPWMVRLSMGCGGALINDQWVLTASHCIVQGRDPSSGNVMSARNIQAFVGAHNMLLLDQDNVYTISEVHAHPRYVNELSSTGRMDNDIALLKLSRKVKFDANAQPVCLPDAGDNYQKHADGLMLAGFGTAAWSAQKNTMRMCAKVADGSGCMGDSGGPLVALKNGKYTVVGAVSYGSMTCDVGANNVYAHVPNYRAWIKRLSGV